MRYRLELEALDMGEIARDACDGIGQEAARAIGDEGTGGEGEQGEPDGEPADRAVDLGQELGLGDDDRELPALEPQG